MHVSCGAVSCSVDNLYASFIYHRMEILWFSTAPVTHLTTRFKLMWTVTFWSSTAKISTAILVIKSGLSCKHHFYNQWFNHLVAHSHLTRHLFHHLHPWLVNMFDVIQGSICSCRMKLISPHVASPRMQPVPMSNSFQRKQKSDVNISMNSNLSPSRTLNILSVIINVCFHLFFFCLIVTFGMIHLLRSFWTINDRAPIVTRLARFNWLWLQPTKLSACNFIMTE